MISIKNPIISLDVLQKVKLLLIFGESIMKNKKKQRKNQKVLMRNQLNQKKQYLLTSMNFRKILPYQTRIFKYKAKFIRKILNLLVIS